MEDIMRLIIIQIGTEYFGIDIFKSLFSIF